jgi:Tfp pilus assembly protein FimT
MRRRSFRGELERPLPVGCERTRTDKNNELKFADAIGLTLLETVVVLALAATLCGAAAPYAAGVLAELELRDAAVRVAAALVRGRSAALRDGRTWHIVADGRTLSLGPVGDEGEREEERETLPGRVEIASSTSGGEVRFSPSGMAENATFIVALDGRSRRVIVNQRGRVTLE